MKKLLITILTLLMILTFTACEDEALATITKIDDLNGKKIGVITGSLNEDIVEKEFVGAETVYYNTLSDAILALENGKVDGLIYDEPTAKFITLDNPGITYLDHYFTSEEFGFAFSKDEKGGALRDEMNAFINKCINNGSLILFENKWIEQDYNVANDLSETITLSGENGTIVFAVDAELKPPMAFLRNGRIVGYEIDLMTLFCREYGYKLEVVDMTTDGMFSAVDAGKADIAGSGINMTEERSTIFNYSSAYYSCGTVVIVRDVNVAKSSNLFINIKDSFISAFITEDRWQMYFEGIGVTLLISLSSLLLGAFIGYGAFLMAYYLGGNYKKFVDFLVKIVDGVPILVFLMIFYYLIFGKIDIPGIIIAIFCFSFSFAAATISMFYNGLAEIDASQDEAARSLGYTKVQSFLKILLPQIFQIEYSDIREEIIYIIQSTSVVGFIAVTDLTKVNDLIRARTYDAFFPLILIAVIYFLLAFAVSKLVGLIVDKFNPRNRKPEDILKGVETDD